MKRNRKQILILLVLTALTLAIWQWINPTKSTINEERSDFAIEDTGSISKIFIADKGNRTILLERRGNSWIVNGLYGARQDAIQNLLYTMKELEVRNPVPKSAFENVVKQIAGNATKVEVYQGEENPSKVYYVGHSNKDHSGTYMLLEGSSDPFVMHLPGMYGYLGPRFFLNENDWRSHEVFALAPDEISAIQVEYPEEPQESFRIEMNDESIVMIDLFGGKVVENVDSVSLFRYLSLFGMVNFESFEETKSELYLDTIKGGVPLGIVTVVNNLGFQKEIRLFKKPIGDWASDPEGFPIDYDLDRLYAWVDQKDMVVMQYYVTDPITLRKSDFIR